MKDLMAGLAAVILTAAISYVLGWAGAKALRVKDAVFWGQLGAGFIALALFVMAVAVIQMIGHFALPAWQ